MSDKTIEADLNKLREDLAALAKDVKEMAAQRVGEERAAAGERLEALRAKGQAAVSRAGEGVSALEQQVAKHPFSSLMVAFCAGLLVGRLLDR